MDYRICSFLISLMMITVSCDIARAENVKTVSVEGGYTRVGGYYSGMFQAAPVFGLRFIPFMTDYLHPDASCTLASFRFSGNDNSQLLVSGIDAGINARYKVGIATPFAGAALGMRYFYFHGKKTDEKIHTLKPALGLRAGVMMQINERLSAEVRSEYTASSLSGER
ncbi:MAG TPA: hypothetical protein VF857_05215, partial [Spirochaetota bacterium]